MLRREERVVCPVDYIIKREEAGRKWGGGRLGSKVMLHQMIDQEIKQTNVMENTKQKRVKEWFI